MATFTHQTLLKKKKTKQKKKTRGSSAIIQTNQTHTTDNTAAAWATLVSSCGSWSSSFRQTELYVHDFERAGNVLKCGAGHQTNRPCCSHGTEGSSLTIGAIVPRAPVRFSIVHVHSQNQVTFLLSLLAQDKALPFS